MRENLRWRKMELFAVPLNTVKLQVFGNLIGLLFRPKLFALEPIFLQLQARLYTEIIKSGASMESRRFRAEQKNILLSQNSSTPCSPQALWIWCINND